MELVEQFSWEGRTIACGRAGAEYLEVAGAGHLVQYDAPVALTSAIRSWLGARAPS